MTDDRFYERAGPFTLVEIAGRVGAEIAKGEPAELKLRDVASLESAEAGELTPRELRRMYHDFSISQPASEQTFWGTSNTVVIAWGSSTPLQSDLQVLVYIDGKQQPVTQSSTMALTLDRGEHNVYAELLDSRGRRLVTTSTVTFFVKQNAVGFNAPSRTSVSGH